MILWIRINMTSLRVGPVISTSWYSLEKSVILLT